MRLEDCPARVTADVIGGKWKPVILFLLMKGKRRHGELRRLIPDASQKVLTQQLRELEQDEIISRKVFEGVLPKVEYALSIYGESLRPVITVLCDWGKAHNRRKASLRREHPAI